MRLLPPVPSPPPVRPAWPAPLRALRLPRVLVPPHAPRAAVTRRSLGGVVIAGGLGSFAVAEIGPAARPAGVWHVAHGLAPGAMAVGGAEGVILGALLGTAWRRGATHARASALGVLSGAALAVAGAFGTGTLDPARAGATAAACVAAAWLARRGTGGPGRSVVHDTVCAADYPLVGAVALLTPVVWLAGAAGSAGGWAAVPLATAGGGLLATVRASRGPATRGGPLATCALILVWSAAAAAPLTAADPGLGIAAVALAVAGGVGVAAWLRDSARERRFEQRAIRATAPALAAAASALVVLPPTPATSAWTGAYLGLVLVAGYLAAEARGRTEWATRVAWRRVGPVAAAGLVAAELARAVATDDGASPWRALAAFAAARVGAALYHAHRAHVRALRAAGTAAGRAGVRGPGVAGDPRGYIRGPWQPPPAACSTRARWSAPSSAWPTRSSS